jgi:DNA-binding winged helix-turn-helix (wHTH) protein/TolB-like protein/tetratricopeptide (TPR) repeat protein
MDPDANSHTYRFSGFVLDTGAHELRSNGQRIRVERRPFRLLVLLVSRAGLVVTREEIVHELWPPRVVIDFDTGLNTLVRKLRQALGDSPDTPSFIETVPGVGYRFIAPLDQTAGPTPASAPEGSATPPLPAAPPTLWRRNTVAIVLVFLAVAGLAVGSRLMLSRPPPQLSIAVLPFENLTGNEELNYLAAGLAEDTSASLAQLNLDQLRMMGRASALSVVGTGKPLAQIGRELGVDFVVASSLRSEGSRIRVTARLLRVADNVEIWTASFDRELTSTLGLERELSIAITEQVRLRLSPDVRAAIENRQTRNPMAYDLYLRGRHAWSQLSPVGNRQALEFYQEAIARDPGYALAWAGIAHVLSTAPITGEVEPALVATAAREAVDHALEFGEELAEVQIAHGYFHYLLDWNWRQAETAFRKAVTLDPNSAIAHLMLGHVLSQLGEHAEARLMARRARELDPFFSHTFALSATIAFQAHDFASAVEFGRQAVAINPEGWVGHLNLGQAQAELGQYAEALQSFDDAARYSSDNFKSLGFRAYVLARMGREREARAVIAALEAKSRERYVPPYVIALIHAGLDEREATFEWLERAYHARDVHLVFLAVDPRWDDLRNDPQFESLLRRCGFVGPDSADVSLMDLHTTGNVGLPARWGERFGQVVHVAM